MLSLLTPLVPRSLAVHRQGADSSSWEDGLAVCIQEHHLLCWPDFLSRDVSFLIIHELSHSVARRAPA
jgi:hypothetical protein